MKRIFITTISLQSKKGLEKVIYEPVGFEFSKEERRTSFPIIPVLAENMERKEEIEIIAIRIKNADTADNYKEFVKEVSELGLEEDCIHVLEVPEKQDIRTQVQLLIHLIDLVPNHSTINACVTFGTKPISIIITYALNFITKLLSDVDVDGIYYGEIVRENNVVKGYKIYNLIGLLLLGNIIEQIDALEFDNPKESLKRLLDLN